MNKNKIKQNAILKICSIRHALEEERLNTKKNIFHYQTTNLLKTTKRKQRNENEFASNFAGILVTIIFI